MSETKLFDIFVNGLNFNINDYLVDELTEYQKEVIENATFIMKDNIVEEVKAFGGSVKKNDERFNEMISNAERELEKEQYKEIKKDLKEYLKKLSEMIIKTCVAIIPIKELPWIDVIFRTMPNLTYDGKVHLVDNEIAYYGEVKYFTGRTIVYGRIKDEAPLFAPLTGDLDLGGFKTDDLQSTPKSHNFQYVNAILNSFNSPLTKNQVAKYHENFQRHGDPICDFLNKDSELMGSMEKLTISEKSDIDIFSIILPIASEKQSLVIVKNDSNEDSRYEVCFEALLKLSAASCNVPSLPSDGITAIGQEQSQDSVTVRTPGGQELKVWTSEELVQEAQQRLSSQPNLPTWTEEDLLKHSKERGSGIPEGMEVWTEEQLQELAEKRRGGGLNIPEWKPDDSLTECSNCGYSLRPGWSTCPICDTPVEKESSQKESEENQVESINADEESTANDEKDNNKEEP